MKIKKKDLYVKESTLPNAGKGLFTRVDIPKGTTVVEYEGERTKWKHVKNDEGKNKYIFYISDNLVIDAGDNEKSLGRYANDARGLTRVKGIKNNSEYVVEGKRVFIVATRKIPADSEILVSYGKDYWKVIKHNMKIDGLL